MTTLVSIKSARQPLTPARDHFTNDLAALVADVDALRAQAEALVDRWEQERLELPKLLVSSLRSADLDRDIEEAAAAAGIPVDRFRFDWINAEQQKRSHGIAGAQTMIRALNDGVLI